LQGTAVSNDTRVVTEITAYRTTSISSTKPEGATTDTSYNTVKTLSTVHDFYSNITHQMTSNPIFGNITSNGTTPATHTATSVVKRPSNKFGANIVFAFDTSCSTSDDIKNGTKRFIEEFVRKFDLVPISDNKRPRDIKFGMLAFDQISRKVFGFGDGETQADVINATKNFDYAAVGCKTIFSKALKMLIEDFFESGEQDDHNSNVLILLTDGRTHPKKFIKKTMTSMKRLRTKSNAYVFLVQLPNKDGKTAFNDTKEQVNGLAEQDNIFQYSSDSKSLAEIVYARLNFTMQNLKHYPGSNEINGNSTIQCVQDVPLDVLIILDNSKSLKTDHRTVVRDAMKALVETFNDVGDGNKSVKFALLTYNDRVMSQMLFNETASSTKAATLGIIGNESMTLGKRRRTDLALEFANSVVFTPAAGDRPAAYN
ncbi:unnamed protein product, partial [Owenia fusiformis]